MPDIRALRFPQGWLGAIEVLQSKFFGLRTKRQRIGVRLFVDEATKTNENGAEFSVTLVIDLFVHPSLSNTGLGAAKISIRNQTFDAQSDSGHVEIHGKISADFQTIEATATIRNFQLMDVAGDFLDHPIVLLAL